MDSRHREIMIKIVAVTVSELNNKVPASFISGLKVGISTGRGHAYLNRTKITIPTWVFKKSIHYIRYLVCHEVAHLVAFRVHGTPQGHGDNFKKIERLFCSVFDVRLAFPERHHDRAYPIAICGPDGHFERSGL